MLVEHSTLLLGSSYLSNTNLSRNGLLFLPHDFQTHLKFYHSLPWYSEAAECSRDNTVPTQAHRQTHTGRLVKQRRRFQAPNLMSIFIQTTQNWYCVKNSSIADYVTVYCRVLQTSGVSHFVLTHGSPVSHVFDDSIISISAPCCLNKLVLPP